MDVQMPIMNGIEATAIIRNAAGPNRTTPIIAITAHAIASEKDALLHNGINDFITKPINEMQLAHMIAHWCHSEKNSREPAVVDMLQSLKLSNNKITLACEMFTMLMENLDQDMQEITRAAHNGNTEKLLTLVHKLHGACCYTGVPLLKSAVKHIEILIKNGPNAELDTALAELTKIAGELLQWHRDNNFRQLIEQLQQD